MLFRSLEDQKIQTLLNYQGTSNNERLRESIQFVINKILLQGYQDYADIAANKDAIIKAIETQKEDVNFKDLLAAARSYYLRLKPDYDKLSAAPAGGGKGKSDKPEKGKKKGVSPQPASSSGRCTSLPGAAEYDIYKPASDGFILDLQLELKRFYDSYAATKTLADEINTAKKGKLEDGRYGYKIGRAHV